MAANVEGEWISGGDGSIVDAPLDRGTDERGQTSTERGASARRIIGVTKSIQAIARCTEQGAVAEARIDAADRKLRIFRADVGGCCVDDDARTKQSLHVSRRCLVGTPQAAADLLPDRTPDVAR